CPGASISSRSPSAGAVEHRRYSVCRPAAPFLPPIGALDERAPALAVAALQRQCRSLRREQDLADQRLRGRTAVRGGLDLDRGEPRGAARLSDPTVPRLRLALVAAAAAQPRVQRVAGRDYRRGDQDARDRRHRTQVVRNRSRVYGAGRARAWTRFANSAPAEVRSGLLSFV